MLVGGMIIVTVLDPLRHPIVTRLQGTTW